jgi:PAS domain S-box-containing protein
MFFFARPIGGGSEDKTALPGANATFALGALNLLLTGFLLFTNREVHFLSALYIITALALVSVLVIIHAFQNAAQLRSLQESEERFRQLAENIQEVFWLTDPVQNKIIYASPAYEAIWQRPVEELYEDRLAWVRNIDERDRNRVQESFLGHMSKNSWEEEYRIIRPDGSIRWIRDRGFVIRNAKNEICRLCGVAEDVTEHRLVHEALATANRELEQRVAERTHELSLREERFRKLVENAWDVFVLIEPSGRIQFATESIRRVMGYSLDEYVGRNSFELVHPEDLQRVQRDFGDLLSASGATASLECRGLHKNGTWRWVEVTGTNLIADPAIRAIVVSFHDITGRQKAEEELRKGQQMLAMGTLVAGLAHEVRNPLFALTATVDALEARYQHSRELGPYLINIRRQLDRLGELMRELLEFGQPPETTFVLESLDEIVSRAVYRCSEQALQAGVTVMKALGLEGTKVHMNPVRVSMLFRNLIENAIQHTARGGAIFVTGQTVSENGHLWNVCVVRDTGPGFTPGDLARVFEPFFTRRRGGIGLGLAIVQRIVEEHGGHVLADNHPEGGARTTVYLPARTMENDSGGDSARGTELGGGGVSCN